MMNTQKIKRYTEKNLKYIFLCLKKMDSGVTPEYVIAKLLVNSYKKQGKDIAELLAVLIDNCADDEIEDNNEYESDDECVDEHEEIYDYFEDPKIKVIYQKDIHKDPFESQP
jgi:hypothetical protein